MKGGDSSVGADGGADAAFRLHIGRGTEIRSRLVEAACSSSGRSGTDLV